MSDLICRMGTEPARLFHLEGGTLGKGKPADVVVFDPEATWTVDPTRFYSKSRNTPFHGWDLKGRALYTFVGGVAVWEADR